LLVAASGPLVMMGGNFRPALAGLACLTGAFLAWRAWRRA
jgi:hypothetical protein